MCTVAFVAQFTRALNTDALLVMRGNNESRK